MSLKLSDPVPDFTQDSTEGPLNFYDWSGDDWVVLFSHPRDFPRSAPPSSAPSRG